MSEVTTATPAPVEQTERENLAINEARRRGNAHGEGASSDLSILQQNGITLPRGEISGTASGRAELMKRRDNLAGWWDRQVREGGGSEKGISGETAVHHVIRLREYADFLAGSEDLTDILSDPARASDRLIMDKICTVLTDTDGKPVKYTADENKIIQFLQTSEGVSTSLMLLEQEAMLDEMGSGMIAIVEAQKFKGQERTTRDGVKGVIESAPTARKFGKIGLKQAVVGLMSAGYFAGGDELLSGLTFSSDQDLLIAVKRAVGSRPNDISYLRARSGGLIDLDLIDDYGNPKDAKSYNPNYDALQTRITSAHNLRRDTLIELGFEPRQIRFPEEHIFNDQVRAEDIPMGYLREIFSEYGKNVRAKIPYGATRTEERRIRLREMAKARSKVMVEYQMRDVRAKEAEQAKTDEARAIDKLKAKSRMMKENPDEYLEEERDKHTKERTKAQKGKTEAEARRKEEVDGDTSIAKRTEAVTTIIDELTSDAIGVEVSDNIEEAIKKKKQELRDSIADMEDPAKPWQHKLDERFQAAEKAEKDARDSYESAVAKLTKGATMTGNLDEVIKAATAKVDAKFGPVLSAMQKKYDKLTQQLEALEAKEKDYGKVVREEREAVLAIRGKEPQLIAQTEAGYNTFIGFGIIDDDIRDNSVDDLMAMLPGAMTPEEKLKTVLQAKAFEEAQRTLPLPQYQKDALFALQVIDALYTPDYVLRMGKDEVYQILINEIAVDPLAPTDVERAEATRDATAALKGATSRFRSIVESRSGIEVGYYDAKIKAEDKALEALSGDKFKERIAVVDAAITVLENATKLGADNTLSKIYAAADNPARLALLQDVTPVVAGDVGYTAAETALGKERRLYEYARLLYQEYVEAPKDRDKMFAAFTELINLDDLDNFLATHYHGDTGNGLRRTTTELLNYIRAKALTL